jgi:hypothetical protein
MNRPEKITVQSDDEARDAHKRRAIRNSKPVREWTAQERREVFLEAPRLNEKEWRRASRKNVSGHCAMSAMRTGASRSLPCARVASMRYVNTKSDSLPINGNRWKAKR